ncbi:MAG TPA: rhodanese-like domain-containing protein [Bryobacteraceae bacterium]|jgi:rhodanese-related sulfurtransferase
MKRRQLIAPVFAFPLFPLALAAKEAVQDPWPRGRLMEPATLAEMLRDPAKAPVVISVVFPVLYRQKHIAGAKFAGPTSKAEGISALKQAVSSLPKDTFIVVYCGCCPMAHCPNIRPAFQTLSEIGYTNVHVLDLPSNFRTDWMEKGYPVEPRS